MKVLWYFIRLYRPFRWWVAASLALACLTLWAQIGLLAVSGWFIAAMGIAGFAGMTMNYFTPAAIIRALAMIRTGGRYAERLVTHNATLRVTSGFRRWFYDCLEELAPSGIQDLHSADIFARLRTDIDTLERFFLQSFLPVLVSTLSLLAVTCALLLIHPPLAWVQLPLLLAVGVALPWWCYHRGRPHHVAMAAEHSQLQRELTENLQGWEELLVYGQAETRRGRAYALAQGIIGHERALHRGDAASQAVACLLTGIAVAGGAWLAIPFVRDGEMPLAFMAMIPLLCLACFDAVSALPAALQSLPGAVVAAGRVFDIVQRPAPFADKPGLLPVPEGAFVLECSAPVLRYDGKRLEPVIAFTLSGGESLAICGASGAGKTSLVNLLAGMWPLEGGGLRLNGQEYGMTDKEQWRACFAVAEQRPYIFAGNVADNLAIAAPAASRQMMEEACRLVEFPLDLWPEGLDATVGEHGNTLSGGQRRRLALARALLKDAPCLILDEPTEGLDGAMADRVLERIRRHCLRKGQSMILISHDRPVAQLCEKSIAL